MINTVVIPAAGLGTRLLTVTKETPKEMLPLFSKINDEIVTRPLIERIFLQLFGAGIRNFYFVVGKKKRAIEDHFTPDTINLSGEKNRNFKLMIRDFNKKIEESNIVWINQNSPKGFGAAVLIAKEIVGKNPFIVHAGDAFIRGNSEHLSKLINAHLTSKSIHANFLCFSNTISFRIFYFSNIERCIRFRVSKVEEKPKRPKSNFALMPLYVFESKIFEALSSIKPGLRNELQLTDAIQQLIKQKNNVDAIKFTRADDCIDIGTPENYFRSLQVSFNDSKTKSN